MDKTKKKIQNANYYNSCPWIKHFRGAWNRCNQKDHDGYEFYGAKGIKLLLHVKDVKALWYRDNADLMYKPRLHRIDPNEDYSVENCQFVELKKHQKIHEDL